MRTLQTKNMNVDRKVYIEMQALAKAQGRSLSDAFREAQLNWVRQCKEKKFRDTVRKLAGSCAGIPTDELDEMRNEWEGRP